MPNFAVPVLVVRLLSQYSFGDKQSFLRHHLLMPPLSVGIS